MDSGRGKRPTVSRVADDFGAAASALLLMVDVEINVVFVGHGRLHERNVPGSKTPLGKRFDPVSSRNSERRHLNQRRASSFRTDIDERFVPCRLSVGWIDGGVRGRFAVVGR